jgi:integrase
MGKRGNGEGSIYEHKRNGKKVGYRGSYTVHTAKGVKRRYVTGKTREEARQKLAREIAHRDGGLVFEAGNQTVGEYLERWLETSVRGSVRESTYGSYGRQARRYLVPAIGTVKLKRLSAMHVQGMYRAMLDKGLSPRTVQYTHAVLHRALKQAVRWGLIPRNVSEDVDRPRLRREEIRPLDRAQTRHLLKTAGESGDRFEALYVLAVHTGMRPGELLGLKWEDLDLDGNGGSLRVNRALSNGKLTEPKRKRSRRRIDLSAGSVAALKVHRKRQLEERVQKAGLWRDHGLVFPSSVGTPLSHCNVVRAFKQLLKRASLPEMVRLYDLRHTCATLLLNGNVHPKYVQELLGHASIAQTLDTYSHILKGMDGGIGDVMDEALA